MLLQHVFSVAFIHFIHWSWLVPFYSIFNFLGFYSTFWNTSFACLIFVLSIHPFFPPLQSLTGSFNVTDSCLYKAGCIFMSSCHGVRQSKGIDWIESISKPLTMMSALFGFTDGIETPAKLKRNRRVKRKCAESFWSQLLVIFSSCMRSLPSRVPLLLPQIPLLPLPVPPR